MLASSLLPRPNPIGQHRLIFYFGGGGKSGRLYDVNPRNHVLFSEAGVNQGRQQNSWKMAGNDEKGD